MSDYREQSARPSTGDIGTPALFFRNDPAGDSSGANQQMSMGQLDPVGAVKVNHEGQAATYTATFSRVAVAATPTDIVILNGSATKTLKVTRVELFISNTTGATHPHDVRLVTRTTANSGGTSSSLSIGGVDVTNDNTTATATGLVYTANPTTGTVGAAIRQAQVSPPSDGAAVVAAVQSLVWIFGSEPGSKCPTLRGVGQGFAINGAASTWGSSPLLSGSITFIEVPTTV